MLPKEVIADMKCTVVYSIFTLPYCIRHHVYTGAMFLRQHINIAMRNYNIIKIFNLLFSYYFIWAEDNLCLFIKYLGCLLELMTHFRVSVKRVTPPLTTSFVLFSSS